MKKTIMIVLSIVLIFGAAACQATPEKDIVKGKNLEKMIEDATKTPESSQSAPGTALKEKLGARDTYTKELQDAKGKVNIKVDAKVLIPDAPGVSVQRVEQYKFTQEQVDTMIKHLVRGELYTGDSYILTKSETEQQILEIEAAMAKNGDAEQDEAEMKKSPPGAARDAGMRKYRLDELKEQLKTAPDTVAKTPSSGKLEPMDINIDGATGEKVYARAQSEKGGFENLEVYNYGDGGGSFLNYTSEKGGFSKNMGYFSTKEQIEKAEALGFTSGITAQEMTQIPDVTITADQAKEKAEALIKDLGIENMLCYSAEKGYGGDYERTADQSAYLNPRKCVWFLRYMRSVNNIPVTYTVWDCMKVEEDNQSAPWAYEDMTFAIDDTGIVGFTWRSPYKVTGTVTENSNLLSFEEITKVFDTMSLAVNAWEGFAEYSPDLTGIEITVDQIKFGLTRITEQDKRDSGLLVPAWDFIGTTTQVMNRDGQTKRYPDGPIPILTVNAIDGSIINRSLGY